jgi:hypothetical protein
MKTAVSVPDEIFRAAERVAKRLGISRSELYSRALETFLGSLHERGVTESYDRAFGPPGDGDEHFRKESARRTFRAIEW